VWCLGIEPNTCSLRGKLAYHQNTTLVMFKVGNCVSYSIRLSNHSYDPNPIQSTQIQIESGLGQEEVLQWQISAPGIYGEPLRRPASVDCSSGLAASAVSCYSMHLVGSCSGGVEHYSGDGPLRRAPLRRASPAASSGGPL
jgi:hypothetical protein